MMLPEDILVGQGEKKFEMIYKKKVRSEMTHLSTKREVKTPDVKVAVVIENILEVYV